MYLMCFKFQKIIVLHLKDMITIYLNVNFTIEILKIIQYGWSFLYKEKANRND